MPPAVTRRKKLLTVLGRRIQQGKRILATAKHIPARAEERLGGFQHCIPAHDILDSQRFAEWRSRCMSAAVQVVPSGRVHRREVEQFAKARADIAHVKYTLAKLRALRSDFADGLLDDPWLLIRADVADDYMAQSEVLAAEGYCVPAAVLAGAVLEDALRKLCNEKGIATTRPGGERRGINAMNDGLAKAGVYNAAKAHEIRAWGDIRNDCAHGDGAKVYPEDVGRMIQGVRAFVADYLR